MAQHRLDMDVIYIKPARVGDLAWLDENGNGLVDEGEPGIPGVTVQLLQDGEAVYETVTDAYGYYLFTDVYPGAYTLVAKAYPELTPTSQVEALRIISSCLVGGDGNEAHSDPFEVESGSLNVNYDLGYLLREGESLPSGHHGPRPRGTGPSPTQSKKSGAAAFLLSGTRPARRFVRICTSRPAGWPETPASPDATARRRSPAPDRSA